MVFFRRDDTTSIQITPYQRRNRQDVRDMLFRNYRSHIHLDWQESDQWLDTERYPVKLAWQGRRLIGVLGASEPIEGNCWIRIAAANDDGNPQPALDAMWESLCTDLGSLQVRRVAILMLRDWLNIVFAPLGFSHHEWVVTLKREGKDAPPEMLPEQVSIRPAEPSDLDTLIEIDHVAFAPLWRMSASDLRQAMRMAASSTVAMMTTTIVGYQISTMYFDGSHLARLAVRPEIQTRGVGTALVSDVLRRFARRGVASMTVNTQLTNERSQHVYERLGFERNGYDLAVWTAAI
jgi:ribosomal-protein-alanine N-acetyltransferase